MLIDYRYLVNKYNWSPKRVLHIGGHRGEEQPYYDDVGVEYTLWIEAIKESAEWMRGYFSDRDNVDVMNLVLSDAPGFATFHITNNGASSSLLPFGLHTKYHPKVHMVEHREVQTVRGDSINWNFDCINIDVQGAELKVLQGCEGMLDEITSIYAEVNEAEVYTGCCLVGQLDEFLKGFGFERVETFWTPYKWGDALYLKPK